MGETKVGLVPRRVKAKRSGKGKKSNIGGWRMNKKRKKKGENNRGKARRSEQSEKVKMTREKIIEEMGER